MQLKLILKRYGAEDEKVKIKALLATTRKEIEEMDADIENLISDFKTDLNDTQDYEKIKKSVTALEKELKKSKDDPDKLRKVQEAKKQFKPITTNYNKRKKDLAF